MKTLDDEFDEAFDRVLKEVIDFNENILNEINPRYHFVSTDELFY